MNINNRRQVTGDRCKIKDKSIKTKVKRRTGDRQQATGKEEGENRRLSDRITDKLTSRLQDCKTARLQDCKTIRQIHIKII
jgi:hypothetical protein